MRFITQAITEACWTLFAFSPDDLRRVILQMGVPNSNYIIFIFAYLKTGNSKVIAVSTSLY